MPGISHLKTRCSFFQEFLAFCGFLISLYSMELVVNRFCFPCVYQDPLNRGVGLASKFIPPLSISFLKVRN